MKSARGATAYLRAHRSDTMGAAFDIITRVRSPRPWRRIGGNTPGSHANRLGIDHDGWPSLLPKNPQQSAEEDAAAPARKGDDQRIGLEGPAV